MPLIPPVTAAEFMARLVPVLRFVALMPSALVPVTAPVDVTDRAPEPRLSARIPLVAPVTAAELMVRLVAVLRFVALMPLEIVPVTAPVDVTDRAPEPRLSARIPLLAPVTAAELTVRLVPALLFMAAIPLYALPVTRPVDVTDRAPEPRFLA